MQEVNMAGSKILRNTTNGERVYNKEATDAFLAKTVKIEGNQSISGIKTFGQSPIVPMPTEPKQAANKDYADLIIGNFVIPDYARTETVNRITAPGGSWTADRTGFVVCDMKGQSTAAQQYIWGFVKIKTKMVYQNLGFSIASGNNLEFQEMFPVKAGDVVLVDTQGTANNKTVTCYFIPIAPQNNFNVYTDWAAGTIANGYVAFPKTVAVNDNVNIMTAPQDGTVLVNFGNNGSPDAMSLMSGKYLFVIDNVGVLEKYITGNSYSAGQTIFNLKKGQQLSIQPRVVQTVDQVVLWRMYPNRVSVANAASAWIEYTGTNAVTPSSAMTFANAANTVLRYNPSLGIISLSLNRVNISTITDQTVLGTYSANVPLLSKVNFVEGDCHYPLYGFKIELRKNSRNIYFRNMANVASAVFNDVYFNDVIGYV